MNGIAAGDIVLARRALAARIWWWGRWPALVGALFGLFLLGLHLYNRAMLAVHADHLFDQVLAGGRPDQAYAQADVRLQAVCAEPLFLELARRRPNLFRRDRVSATDMTWMRNGNEIYALLQARVEEGEGWADVTYYSRMGSGGEWRLVGIAPDLMAAVPSNLEPAAGPPTRKGR